MIHIKKEKKKKSLNTRLTCTNGTVVPTKSDRDVILCLQLLSKILTCTIHLNYLESIDHLCINPILWIGLTHK